MSTMKEDTSDTDSIRSSDPRGVAAGSEHSALPSFAAAEADVLAVAGW